MSQGLMAHLRERVKLPPPPRPQRLTPSNLPDGYSGHYDPAIGATHAYGYLVRWSVYGTYGVNTRWYRHYSSARRAEGQFRRNGATSMSAFYQTIRGRN